MPLSSLSFALFRFLLPPALLSLLWLYLYAPINGCSFPLAVPAQASCMIDGTQIPPVIPERAPFRLLVLADPQLEGDSSLPDPSAPLFPHLGQWTSEVRGHGTRASLKTAGFALSNTLTKDLLRVLQTYRKRLDLFGNDYYLAHVYRSVKWWTDPTHAVVLGDLLGSQWVDDAEFARRAARFWDRVFADASPVPATITGSSGRDESLGQDHRWANRIISVAGNHDVGYAGDIDESRITRFEKHFGHVNWNTRFKLSNSSDSTASRQPSIFSKTQSPALNLVVLNSMVLDEPTASPSLRDTTWQFLTDTLASINSRADPHAAASATILLTHVPFHKEAGTCPGDAPFIENFPDNYGGGIREQNHLTPESSTRILNALPPQALVLNGHDHVGCDVLHTRRTRLVHGEMKEVWRAKRLLGLNSTMVRREVWKAAEAGSTVERSLREITVRSMMGEFGGNAGMLSAWYDGEAERWRFEYSSCTLGVQHWWWATHVLALIEAGLLATGVLSLLLQRLRSRGLKQKTE